MVKICCEDMKNNMCFIDQNNSFDKIIYYSSKFNEYGLPIYDGENGRATSYIQIIYCPWCGNKLPDSKRDEWFCTLERLGYDSPLEENIPEKFKNSEWYESEQSEDGDIR